MSRIERGIQAQSFVDDRLEDKVHRLTGEGWFCEGRVHFISNPLGILVIMSKQDEKHKDQSGKSLSTNYDVIKPPKFHADLLV